MAVPVGTLVARRVFATTSVAFVWDEVTGATSYRLQVGTETTASNIFNFDVGAVRTWTIGLWAATYTPLAYPHYLRSDAAAPAPPTQLRVVMPE